MNKLKLKVAFQMDNINNIINNDYKFNNDSTIALINEAFKRGFELYYYMPANLTLKDNKVLAIGQQILNISYTSNNKLALGQESLIDLSTMHIIWVRQDPPFDIAYITTTYILDYLINKHSNILVFNNPKAIRDYTEKIIAHYFSEFMPKTLITKNKQLIYDFLNEEQQIVIKPLYDARGNSVYLLNLNDPNVDTLINHFLTTYKEPIIVQKFLKNVSLGDKRILIVDGNPLGYFNRIPQVGITSNMARGGTVSSTILTDKELDISKTVGSFLKKNNILLAGIDIIDEQLTEINITSPTGIRNYLKFSNINIAVNIWDIIIEKLKLN